MPPPNPQGEGEGSSITAAVNFSNIYGIISRLEADNSYWTQSLSRGLLFDELRSGSSHSQKWNGAISYNCAWFRPLRFFRSFGTLSRGPRWDAPALRLFANVGKKIQGGCRRGADQQCGEKSRYPEFHFESEEIWTMNAWKRKHLDSYEEKCYRKR